MTASVWNPGASSQVLSNLNRISQEFTALAGQTTFVLLTPPYTPGAQNLEVFKAGEKIPTSEVTEVVGGVSFGIAACVGGEKIEAVVFPSTSSVFTTLVDQAAASAAAAAVSATAAAASLAGLSQFTGAAIAGALSFVGNGGRIRANLSGALLRDRLLFEPDVTTAAGSVSVVPGGGGGVGSDFTAYGRHPDDVVGCSTISISAAAVGGINRLVSDRTLAVAYNPLALSVGGTDKLEIAADTTGTYKFQGTAPRITGDFSNATLANRLIFQSSTVNGATDVGVTPNGTSTTAGFTAYNAADPTNASTTTLQTTSTQSKLIAGKAGSGSYKPLALSVGGTDVATYSEAAATLGNMTASVSRNSSLAYVVGNYNAGASATCVYQLGSNAGSVYLAKGSTASGHGGGAVLYNTGGSFSLGTTDAGSLSLKTNNTDRVTIDSTGNVGVGAANAGYYGKFTVSGTGYQAITVVDSEASGAVCGIAANGTVNVNVGAVSNHDTVLIVNGVPAFKMDTAGNSLHVRATGGLGYGTGAGGTVTQTTSKSTAVTLNKPTGLITTFAI